MNFELEGFYCNKIHFNLFSRYIKFEKVQIHKKVQIIIGGIKILSAATQRHHKSSLHVLPSRYSSIHDELWELSFMELFWAMATWRLSSFTTNARASGLTPVNKKMCVWKIESKTSLKFVEKYTWLLWQLTVYYKKHLVS